MVDPSVPLELSLLIMKLLEKDPSNRPASARAVADALATIERTSSLVAAPPPTAVPRASTVATAKRTRRHPSARRRRPGRAAWRRDVSKPSPAAGS